MTYIKFSTMRPEITGLRILIPKGENNIKMIKYICSDGDMALTLARHCNTTNRMRCKDSIANVIS